MGWNHQLEIDAMLELGETYIVSNRCVNDSLDDLYIYYVYSPFFSVRDVCKRTYSYILFKYIFIYTHICSIMQYMYLQYNIFICPTSIFVPSGNAQFGKKNYTKQLPITAALGSAKVACHLSNEKRAPSCLGCIGDFFLRNYMGIFS